MRQSSIILSAAALFVAACGSSVEMSDGGVGGNGNCVPYAVPPGTDLTLPTISFKHDVMRLFNNSCGLSTCHGTTTAPQGGLFLGAESAMRSDAAAVNAMIVGRSSGELPSMPFVTAGDPSQSYLMHKLDGDQCQFDSRCSGGSCLSLMPSGGSQLLPSAIRDLLRRWIAQGAQDN
jgi:hypothetical protein